MLELLFMGGEKNDVELSAVWKAVCNGSSDDCTLYELRSASSAFRLYRMVTTSSQNGRA